LEFSSSEHDRLPIERQRPAAKTVYCRDAGKLFECGNGFGFEWADLLLVGAVIAASLGYVYGAQVTP